MTNWHTSEQSKGEDGLRANADVPELHAIATSQLYETNPFRLLGVSVGASAREISRRIDHVKMEAELRHTSHPPKRGNAGRQNGHITEDAIREAVQLLRSPVHRFLYELFWLWPNSYPEPGKDDAIAQFQEGTQGSITSALDTWRFNSIADTNADNDPAKLHLGLVAKHNLVVAGHYLALAAKLNGSLENAWNSAVRGWTDLIEDEGFWDLVSIRIRRMDDSQITTGLARRIRDRLPYALASINATCVIQKAGNGTDEEAHFHSRCISAWELPEYQKDQLLHAVSKAVRERITSFSTTAKRRAESDATQAMECANALLRDTGPDFAKLTSLFGQSHEAVIELSDEVATVSLNAGVAYQRETGDDEALLKLCVAAARKLRVSERVSDRLNATSKRAIANIYFEREIQPLLKKIEEVAAIPSSKERFEKLQSDIAPIVAALGEQNGQEGFEQCRTALAYAFRAVSIKAHNEDRNFELAFSAIQAAINYVTDREILGQLEQDLAQLNKNKQERDSFNVRLKIRSTDVEISESRCRCDTTILAPREVTGVRWGIYVHTVNGISSHYYTLWVGGRSTQMEIECKPLLRDIDDARRDFQSIARGLYYHVVPGLIDRIVTSIYSKGSYPVGPLLAACNQQGMNMSKGALFWKEEIIVPYADISMSCAQGSLYVRSIRRPEFNTSFSLRDCWNAVIFEEIVAALVKRKSSK